MTLVAWWNCPHDCPCDAPKQRIQSQHQPTRSIGEVENSEGFTRKIEVGREARFRLANRRLQPLGHLTAFRKYGIYWPLDRFAGDPTSGTTFGAFAAALCNTYQEEGGASCLPDTFRFAAIGGAIGAGAGLAIDAARSHRGVTVRIAIRF